jgi:hypothetical protein
MVCGFHLFGGDCSETEAEDAAMRSGAHALGVRGGRGAATREGRRYCNEKVKGANPLVSRLCRLQSQVCALSRVHGTNEGSLFMCLSEDGRRATRGATRANSELVHSRTVKKKGHEKGTRTEDLRVAPYVNVSSHYEYRVWSPQRWSHESTARIAHVHVWSVVACVLSHDTRQSTHTRPSALRVTNTDRTKTWPAGTGHCRL